MASHTVKVVGISGDKNSTQESPIEINGIKYVIHNGQQETVENDPIWFNISEPVKSFTGRQDILKALHDALQTDSGQVVISQIASISGLGGIGKSELARKYAWDYKDYYNNHIWINAETRESIQKSFHELAKDLKIAITEKKDEKEHERDIKFILRDVYKYLQNAKSLIIFDNVEEYEDSKEFLPISCFLSPDKRRPYILMTSRKEEWETSIKVVSLGTLTEEEATQFIKETLSIKNNLQDENAKRLAEKLHYFPLSLQQAVAYIKAEDKILTNVDPIKQFKISDYLKEYERNAEELLDFKFTEIDDFYTKTTITVWQTTIDKIKRKAYGKKALEILNMMAYFAPDDIPSRIFLQLVNGNERELGYTLQLLKEYSIVRLKKGVSNIHRLVQQVIRLELHKKSKEEYVLGKALKLMNDVNGNVLAKENQNHVISIWDYASTYQKLIDDYYFKSNYDWDKKTPLHLLAQSGRYHTIRTILTHMEKNRFKKLIKIVNATTEYRETPLHFADNLDIVKYLIEEKGADFNSCNFSDRTPLHSASQRGKLDVVKYLIEEKGVNFNSCDFSGKTLLHFVAQRGKLELLKYLIEEKGADVNSRDNGGRTPLFSAAEWGRLDIVKYLIEVKDADFNSHDNDSRTLLQFASERGKLDVVKYLIEEKGADGKSYSIFGKAFSRSADEWVELDTVKYLIEEKGIDFNRCDNDGRTSLHFFVERGKLDVVKFLIEEKGADFNSRGKDGKNPLHLAAKSGYLDIVKYLIEDKGIDFNSRDTQGRTPLQCAAERGNFYVVKYLIEEKRADFNSCDTYEKTPLRSCVEWGEIDILKYLIEEKGADFNSLGNDGKTLLHFAAKSGYLDIMKYLIEDKGIDFNSRDGNGRTPLHSAAERGKLYVVKYLIEEKGADFISLDNDGKSLLHFAAERSRLDVVEYLIEEKGADFNYCDNDGKTLLHFSAERGKLDVVEYLIEEKGADFNFQDSNGRTPLHFAAQHGKLDVVKYLIEEIGTDINSLDKFGKTPLYLADKSGKLDLIKYIEKRNGKKYVNKPDNQNKQFCYLL